MGKIRHTVSIPKTKSDNIVITLSDAMEKCFEIRPPCPDCGSRYIISKGASWLCKVCGRWFRKIIRSDGKINAPGPCVYCLSGAESIISYGTRWRCNVCNKTWGKNLDRARRENLK